MMKRIVKGGALVCVVFFLLACSLTRTLSGESEADNPATEDFATQPIEPEIAQPAPTAEPVQIPSVHRIVYEKAGNIWAVDPDTSEFMQITFDGSADNADMGSVRYFRPLVSPDGAYVAFSTATKFHIYSLASMEMDEIEKASSPDILADVILDWDADNLLYYTRTNGGCDLSASPIRGPDSVDVMRYDPVTKISEKVAELPKIDDAPFAYSIGKTITPSGRFITAYNAVCSAGYGSTFLYDVQTRTYVRNDYPDAVLSNDDSTLAYIDASNLEMAGSTIIVGMDRESQNRETLYTPLMSGFVMMDVAWSPDDAYLAFTEADVLDPDQIWGMGEYFNPDALGDPYLVLAANDQSGQQPETHFIPESRHIFGSWSPDGRAVVYVQWDEGGDRYGAGSLMVYDLDTRAAAVLDHGDKVRNPDW